VRYVYQPLDELYMVLITNRQSNILQDIDSLHLFAQVVSSICKSLDEREILKHAFELLSAFDELVCLGYRENLTLSQIKTFLDMDSHEERIQEIIARNKELEASEERKRKAKQLEMQRKEMARTGRGMPHRTPTYPTYTPAAPVIQDTYDAYNAEKKAKSLPSRGKGMQLGKKSKTTNAFEKIKDELGPETEITSPIAPQPAQASAHAATASSSHSTDREAVHITIAESISAKVTRDGTLESFDVKGDLQLRISDQAFTQIRLNLALRETHDAQLLSHPKVDRALFKDQRVIQNAHAGQGFPMNQSIGVVRWKYSLKSGTAPDPPIGFTVWVSEAGDNTWNITVEYQWSGDDPLRDVTVSIPYTTTEPSISSFDAIYEVTGDSIDWTIGGVDKDNANGSFEFEAQAADESEFFPMSVHFANTRPFVDVDVSKLTRRKE
jgi:coatomer subunit delta